MLRRALTQGLMTKYRRGIITPVIIKSKENLFDSLITELQEIRKSFNLPHLLDFQGMTSLFGLKKIRMFNMVSIPLIADLVEDLSESVKVEKMYPDLIKYAFQDGVFTDRRGKQFTTTYYTKRVIGADKANQEGFTGKGVKVVVIDTGIRASHPQARRFITRTAAPEKGMLGYDNNGHGTHVSTTIAGSYQLDHAYNAQVEGMAPDTTLISIQSLGYVVGMGSTSDILKAMSMAIEIGADIVSMSLGSNEAPPDAENPEAEAINKLVEHNIIPVVAAGNSGPGAQSVGSPGSVEKALTVGAWDTINNKLADFSSRGPTKGDGLTKPDVIAPGYRIDCLSYYTRILTMAGYKQIKFIKKGDQIINYNVEKQQFEVDMVGLVAKRPRREDEKVYRIKTNEGHIIDASEDHKFLVEKEQKNIWVRVKDLHIGDHLLSYDKTDDACKVPVNVTISQGMMGSERLVGENNPNYRGGKEIICEVCGNKRYVTPAHFKTAKYCSRRCRYKAQMGKPFSPCTQFKSEDVLGEKNPFYGKHHTKDAIAKIKAAKGMVMEERVCPVCLDIFTVPKRLKRVYCSRKCSYDDKRRSGFFITLYKKGWEKLEKEYGSDWHKIISAKGLKTLQSREKRTIIETLLEAILKELNIKYTSQYLIDLGDYATVADFAIPDLKIAIYADGDYWHNKPKVRGRDAYINKRLRELGWKVLRYWEEEIHQKKTEIVSEIKSVIPVDPIITEIQEVEINSLYDVEGIKNHTLVANGIIVHNSGTVGLIDAQSPGQFKYASISGTSMATPHVSGILSCARQMYAQQGITLSVDMVKEAMKLHTSKTKNNSDGYGMITWDILKSHLQHAGGKAA
ncbi:MAG: S8 family serine peptidase [Methanolobus sp.]|uniref:S8 family serine peptidase n=1 Tax=Methanolobus sp. TaxID=1874737 RepID=UPI00273118F8|nr:S8 family serine peptidase [Methanolobus sp.]MDP2217184.1 S8 family serine peptidase [Methanolobus sp.]